MNFINATRNLKQFSWPKILNKIKISVSYEDIIIDYTELFDHLRKKGESMVKTLNGYINNMSLQNWTTISCEEINNGIYRVYINDQKAKHNLIAKDISTKSN